jgi:hypothetical protein
MLISRIPTAAKHNYVSFGEFSLPFFRDAECRVVMWLGFGGWLAFPSKAARLLTTTS